MASLFMQTQRKARHEAVMTAEDMQTTVDSQEQEILSLRQQLKQLKALYQDAKAASGTGSQILPSEIPGETAHLKQRVEKLMGAVAESEKQMRDLQLEMQRLVAQNHEALQKERIAKQTATNEVEALHAQLISLKKIYQEIKSTQLLQETEIQTLSSERAVMLEQLHEAALISQQKVLLEKALAESEQRVQTLQQERALWQETIFKSQNAQEDAEARLKVAHYHLAKKVKETSALTDQTHDLEVQLRECTTDLREAQEKVANLQKLLEEQFQQERRRQEQLQESLKETEALASAWKEKFFKISEKWQDSELRFKEMKKLEEKIQKMQTLWTNFGVLFEDVEEFGSKRRASVEENQPVTTVPFKDEQTPADQIQQVCDVRQTHQNIFDIPQPAKRFKHNLFE